MTERKTPQDRLEKAAPVEKPEGWELLKTPDQVPGWDQADFIAALQPLIDALGEDGDTSSLDPTRVDFRLFGNIGRLVHERFTTDPKAFQALTSGGMDGLAKMLNVCFWYFNLLGKSEGSETS